MHPISMIEGRSRKAPDGHRGRSGAARPAGRSAANRVAHRAAPAAALAIALAFGACVGSGRVGPSGEAERFSPKELRGDFGRFRRALEREAVGLYADRGRLTAMLDEAEGRLGGPMTELEFHRLLSPMVAELRCGHSSLSPSIKTERRARGEGVYFPLGVRIFGESLFVIEDRHATGVAPGTEILSIDGRTAAGVIREITGRMTSDGRDRGRPRYDAERWFAAMYRDYLGAPERFALSLRGPGESGERSEWIDAVRDPALAKTPLGILRDTWDAPYGGEIGADRATLRIPCFGLRDGKAYAARLEDFFGELKRKGTPALVLDLRGNYGGTPAPTVELFKYLIDRPLPFFSEDNPVYLAKWKAPIQPSPLRFSGELYVLMDEAGFSMNGFLLSLLKHHGIGTLVGARSSGGHRCSDASRSITLNATGLRLFYSTQVFSVAVEGMEAGVGVEPDLAVEPTLEDWIAGRDAALETALALAKAGAGR